MWHYDMTIHHTNPLPQVATTMVHCWCINSRILSLNCVTLNFTMTMSLTLHSMDAFCVVPKFLHLLFYSILLAHYTSLYISLYIILHVSPIVNQLNKGPSVILAWMISLFSVMALLHGELSNVSKLWHIDTLTCGEE